jgi:hypothetical protein
MTEERLERLKRYIAEYQSWCVVSTFRSFPLVFVAYLRFQKVTRDYGKSFDFPKHHAKRHVIDDIREVGSTVNCTTRTGEGIHQELAIAYRTASNGKRAEGQVRFYCTITTSIFLNLIVITNLGGP